jgi:hypothetical protein
MSLTAEGLGSVADARHRPEQTLLYQLVERYYPEFARLIALQGSPLPGYVAREFEDYPIAINGFPGKRSRPAWRKRRPPARQPASRPH